MKKIPFVTPFIILAAGAFLAASYGVWFLYSDINSKREEISDLTLAVAEVGVRESRSSVLRTVLRETEGLREELLGYLLRDEDVPAFFATIESAGQDAGAAVTLRDAKVGVLVGATKDVSLEALNFEVAAMGTFASVMHVVALLEALPEDVTVHTLRLSKSGDDWNVLMHISVPKVKS